MSPAPVLPVGSLPVPNALPAELPAELASLLVPAGPRRYHQLLADIIRGFGVSASLDGLGWVLPDALQTALRHVRVAVQVPPNHRALLNQALAALRASGRYPELFAVPAARSTNPLIRFHDRSAATPTYDALGWRLHVGLVGKYEQLLRSGVADPRAALGNACATVALVMPALPPAAAARDWQPTLVELIEQLGPMRRQRPAPNGSTRYQPGTLSSYASVLHQVLLDRARRADFVSRPGGRGGERIGRRDLMIADLLDPDHPARLDYTLDAYQAGQLERATIRPAAAQPAPAAPDAPTPAPRPRRSAAAQAHLDPGATVDDPGRVSRDVLARICPLLDDPNFIPEPLTRASFALAVHLALHCRRGPDFAARLQVGRLAHVTSGPLYLPNQHLIVVQPVRYYGRIDTLVRLLDTPAELTADWQTVQAFRANFPGYLPADVVAAIPLPPPVAQAAAGLWALQAPELGDPRPALLLAGRDALDQSHPLTPAGATELLARLNRMLHGDVFQLPDLTWANFYRTFDAEYAAAGLSAVDRYHISERAWHAHEMPVRYTLRPLADLATAYHAACARVLDGIGAAAAAQGQPLARPQVNYRPWPGLRMGSWHVPDIEVIRAILAFLSRSRPGTLEPADFPAARHAHNQRTRAALVWTGLLSGLRDLEYPRLRRRHIAADRFAVIGKGRQVRVLPLYPALGARFRGLLRGRAGAPAPLFTLYAATGPRQALTTTDVNRQFAAICHHLALPDIDIYGLRHWHRTQLAEAEISDAACNALLGHGHDSVRGFASPALTAALQQEYQRAVAHILHTLGRQP